MGPYYTEECQVLVRPITKLPFEYDPPSLIYDPIFAMFFGDSSVHIEALPCVLFYFCKIETIGHFNDPII